MNGLWNNLFLKDYEASKNMTTAFYYFLGNDNIIPGGKKSKATFTLKLITVSLFYKTKW